MVASVGIFDAHPPLARTAGSAAAEVIRQAIIDGRAEPGQRLKEEELAQQLGISRTPIREALLMLQAEGLVETAPNRGATVRSYELSDLEDMYELRALLEGHAARRAATRIGAEELEQLRASCERFEQLVGGADVPALVSENAVFHDMILAAAGSDRLIGDGAPGDRDAARLQVLHLVLARAGGRLLRITTSSSRTRSSRPTRTAPSSSCVSTSTGPATCSPSTWKSGATVGGGALTSPADGLETNAAAEGLRIGPLAGIRVIELGSLLAGPFTGRLLGDLGAEIIKVEAPGQPDPIRNWGKARYEGRSLWWPVQSRNKKCVTLNLREARGQELLLRLVEHADVVTENFRPGTLERWNIGYEQMCAVNPGIVLARISGYGQTGPYAARAGFASVSEAMGGIRHINGFPDEAPPRMHISLGDSLAGMFAAQGILSALYWRDAAGGGLGQVVDVSLMEAAFALLESTVPEYDRLGIVRGPQGTNLKGIAPSNIFRSRDDKWIVIAANADGRVPATLRRDRPTRARRRRALRHPPGAR